MKKIKNNLTADLKQIIFPITPQDTSNAKIIADKTVGYTKFFLVNKYKIIPPIMTNNRNNKSAASKTPAGKTTIRAISAASVE